MSQTIKFGYWAIRGRAQVSRLILAHSGLQFQQVIYTDAPSWFGKHKHSLGLPFPNLPYLIDGQIAVTEASAIPRHIIRRSEKKDLLGKTHKQMAIVDNLILAWEEIFEPLVGLAFNKKWEDEKAGLFYKLKKQLEKVQNFLGRKNHALGYLTLADFVIAEGSYYLQRFYPDQYETYPSIHLIRETIENLPSTIAYYLRKNSIKTPFLSPMMTAASFTMNDLVPMKLSLWKKQQGSKVLLISGSLRKTSTNTGLLRACIELKFPGLNFEMADITDLPLLNEDLFANYPKSFLRIQQQVRVADAVLFAIPEYNFSMSAAFKNVFDWLTKGDIVIKQKICGMISSGGGQGGKRAQTAFKVSAQFPKLKLMTQPEICIKRFGGQHFDNDGNLIHQELRALLRAYLQAFTHWIHKHKNS